MKKSLMSNIKNFVDSNVRQRIDRVSHNNSEFFTDDLLLVERHFEDIRQVCVDAEKKISTLLQSIQANSSTSQLSAYTQNVQVARNSLSHNTTQQTANLATNTNVLNNSNLNHVQQSTSDDANQYLSNESLSNNLNNQLANSNNNNTKLQSTSVTDSIITDKSQLSEDIQQRHKKLPMVGFLRFLTKTNQKLNPDSLLAISINHCTHLQTQLTKLYLTYEQMIESQCLKPIQSMLEVDIPNVVKLRKLFIKSHNDLESFKAKFNGASQKQLQHVQQQLQPQATSTSYTLAQNSAHQVNANKLDQLKKELDEGMLRFEQARDTYEAEIYGFVCRETELVNMMVRFYHLQADYHQQVESIIRNSLPTLTSTLDCTPRKFAFGTALDEHLRCTGRTISPVLELCVHLLYTQGLKEEGLFRIPGSSIKIKKLKNAINAWFVNLADLSELESDQSRQAGHSCVVALHDIFKNVVGKPCSDLSSKSDFLAPELDDQSLNQHDQLQLLHDQEIILDVHSIAGLLKLYLRELPEPLFTHALYDQWLNALNAASPNLTSANSNLDTITCQQQRNELRLTALKEVLQKLPSNNHENLKHLIRFLNVLANNQQYNKMTSTNLAIAMAPSLIWPKPIEKKDHSLGDDDKNVISQSLSISSFGISASLHAMLLDALISNAEVLFPDVTDFSLPGFKELSLKSSKHRDSKRADRPVKSTSPAGISVASSSSFSSNASNPVHSSHLNASSGGGSGPIARTHSRKGGSMEGLIAPNNDLNIGRCNNEQVDSELINGQISATLSTTSLQRRKPFKCARPVSVQICREDYNPLVEQKPHPAVPPVPLARSHHVKQRPSVSNEPNPIRMQQQKPPAPPVPPPTSIRHQQERLKTITAAALTPLPSGQADDEELPKLGAASAAAAVAAVTAPRPTSLRGTGTITTATTTTSFSAKVISDLTQNDSGGSMSNPNSIRPNVPPPNRPEVADTRRSANNNADSVDCTARELVERDKTSSLSPSFSVCLNDADGDHTTSPLVSLDSLTSDSGSSSNNSSCNESSAKSGTNDSSFEEVDASAADSLAAARNEIDGGNGSRSTCEKTADRILAWNKPRRLADNSSQQPGANSIPRADNVAKCLSPSRSNLSRCYEANKEDEEEEEEVELRINNGTHFALANNNDMPKQGSLHCDLVDGVASSTTIETAGELELEKKEAKQQPPPVRPPRSVSPKSAAPQQSTPL